MIAAVNPLEAITRMAAAHKAASYVDPLNGKMPLGFVKGAALGWGRYYFRFMNGDHDTLFCSQTQGDALHDAIAYYSLPLLHLPVERLRQTWIFACCLPGPESGWKWWEGVDTTNASSETADTAEAGLCQTSWNSHTAAPTLTVPLFQHYLKVSPESLLWRDVFSEGTGGDENHPIRQIGEGTGAQFQALSKLAPTFALEYACIILRCLRDHYGTVNRHKVHINPDLDDMFQQVEKIIATDPATYAAALSDTPAAIVAKPSPSVVVPIRKPTVTTTTTNTTTAPAPAALPALVAGASPVLSFLAGLAPPPYGQIAVMGIRAMPQLIQIAQLDQQILAQLAAAPDLGSGAAIVASHFRQVADLVEAAAAAATGSTVAVAAPVAGTTPSPLSGIGAQIEALIAAAQKQSAPAS